MDYHELLISLERLTRFEYPIKKKNRVYKEILFKNLITPKISLKTYNNYPLNIINSLVKLIWDVSLEKLGVTRHENIGINAYIALEETKTFSCSAMISDLINSVNISKYTRNTNIDNLKEVINSLKDVKFNIEENSDSLSSIYYQYKLNFPLNIDGLLQLASKDEFISENIKRLVWINNLIKKEKKQDYNYDQEFWDGIYKKVEKHREKEGSKFPAKLILLVEGITEEKLLPVFAKQMGIDFDKKGIHLIAAGGKNQSARLYKRFKRELNLPILILLDSDAAPIADIINEELRINDQIFILQNGEFEDILPVELICRAVNSYYRLTAQIACSDFIEGQSRVSILENLWKEKGFGEFHKAEFARIIAENIKDKNDISDTLKQIFLTISGML